MALILLDTDVWSYLYKGDSRAQTYVPHLAGQTNALSFQTIGELHFWATHRNWSSARLQDLISAIQRFKVLHSDDQTAIWWASIRAARLRAGKPIAPQDAWIAACALRHQATLLTHNIADYIGIDGLKIQAV